MYFSKYVRILLLLSSCLLPAELARFLSGFSHSHLLHSATIEASMVQVFINPEPQRKIDGFRSTYVASCLESQVHPKIAGYPSYRCYYLYKATRQAYSSGSQSATVI